MPHTNSLKSYSISRFSPAIQEMCRLRYEFHSYYNPVEPIDYVNRFSLTSDDIPDLLEIASWLGKDEEVDMDGFWDAPLHAWEALTYLDPPRVVPSMLALLNRINWDAGEFLDEYLWNWLDSIGECSAKEAQETGDASLDTIPLFLEALKEKERHSTTRMVLSLAVDGMTRDFPEYRSMFHQILLDDLKELRIGCRDWYAEIVCELAFQEDMLPETVALLKKVCYEGYAETWRYWDHDGLIKNVGLDFENDAELLAIHEKSEKARQILWDFQRCGRTFPKRTMQEARELRDWIIPNLIEVVYNATAYARFGVANYDGTIQFALHLLAEFQAKEALPAVLASLSLSDDEAYELFGDGLHESMPGILYRLAGDNPEWYDQKIRDPQVPIVLQRCLSASLKFLAAKGILSVEKYGGWLRDYLELAIQAESEVLVTDYVFEICDTANPDYLPLVRLAFEKGLVEEFAISLEHAEEVLHAPEPTLMRRDPDDFADADKALTWWAWFDEDEDWEDDWDEDEEPMPHPVIDRATKGMLAEVLPPLSKKSLPETEQTVGRNAPCPCGSGKKYKVCCAKK